MVTTFALLLLIVAILAAAIAVCVWFKFVFWVAPVLLIFTILLIWFVVGGLV